MEARVSEPLVRIEALADEVARVLDQVVPAGVRCAVLDPPLQANVGDSLLWLAQRAYLRKRGAEVAYVGDLSSFSPRLLTQRLGPDGIILLPGGGTLGDLWPDSQMLRERVIVAFPDRRIIQLPQSVVFRDPANLRHARRVLAAHPAFTVLVRDRAAQATARDGLGLSATLCPDLSFLLHPEIPEELFRYAAPPVTDVVWLARRDHEGADAAAGPVHWGQVRGRRFDWTANEGADELFTIAYADAIHVIRAARRDPEGADTATLLAAYDRLAGAHLRRGTRLLAGGRVVITDRLHGHVLTLLLGRPNVALADRFGKVRGCWDEWTGGWPGSRWAETPGEALAAARELLETADVAAP